MWDKLFDTSWRTLAPLSPSTVTADNQRAVDIGISVDKGVESSLQDVWNKLRLSNKCRCAIPSSLPPNISTKCPDDVLIELRSVKLNWCIYYTLARRYERTWSRWYHTGIVQCATRGFQTSKMEWILTLKGDTGTILKYPVASVLQTPKTRNTYPINNESGSELELYEVQLVVKLGCRGGRAVSPFASHQGEPGLILGRVTGFLHVGIVPDETVGRRVFSGISRFPPPFHSSAAPYSPQSPSSALKTSLLRAVQSSSPYSLIHSLPLCLLLEEVISSLVEIDECLALKLLLAGDIITSGVCVNITCTLDAINLASITSERAAKRRSRSGVTRKSWKILLWCRQFFLNGYVSYVCEMSNIVQSSLRRCPLFVANDEADIVAAFRREVAHIDGSRAADGISCLPHRWQRTVDNLGDWFEGLVRLLYSNLDESSSIPGGFAPGFLQVGVGGFSQGGVSRFPRPFIPMLLHSHLTSLLSALIASILQVIELANLAILLAGVRCTSRRVLHLCIVMESVAGDRHAAGEDDHRRGERLVAARPPSTSNINPHHQPVNGDTLKTVHDKMSTFEINLRNKLLIGIGTFRKFISGQDRRQTRASTRQGDSCFHVPPASREDELNGSVRSLLVATASGKHVKHNTPVIHDTYFENNQTLHKWGATVSERLVCSPSTKAIRVQSQGGPHQDIACGNRAGRCRWSAGFLGDLPFPSPFHSGAAPYSPRSLSSALKISLLRAAQISSPTHFSDILYLTVGIGNFREFNDLYARLHSPFIYLNLTCVFIGCCPTFDSAGYTSCSLASRLLARSRPGVSNKLWPN
ncbi:hypothetical protein PR048_027246 [Dryococelus australis]|uniref:Uncharacterized protein n=1 Tax=Dryococelus australis TaxID=614101 RepID=A0ABQ9GGK4_9NEOP|nr:hypothetical protein PR048_027246 [Dryococelus australis]